MQNCVCRNNYHRVMILGNPFRMNENAQMSMIRSFHSYFLTIDLASQIESIGVLPIIIFFIVNSINLPPYDFFFFWKKNYVSVACSEFICFGFCFRWLGENNSINDVNKYIQCIDINSKKSQIEQSRVHIFCYKHQWYASLNLRDRKNRCNHKIRRKERTNK